MSIALLGLLVLAAVVSGGAVPTPEQAKWQNRLGGLIHYNMGTYNGQQGCSHSNWVESNNPKMFNPGLSGNLADTDSWARAMVAANITYAVYVAKHNCGFTTWPTKAKLPDGSPYNYSIQYSSCPDCDIVRDFVASCRRYGIKPGFYYSVSINIYLNVQNNFVQGGPLLPGQINVTQDQYWDIALTQLEELWSKYPDLEEIWFDGGLPNNASFAKRIQDLQHKHQPHAIMYNGYPTLKNPVRWIGTETGVSPNETWSTGSCAQGNWHSNYLPPGGDPDSPDWCPAEVDYTVQNDDTWFYNADVGVRPLSEMVGVYHDSIGHNSDYMLDLAPAPNTTLTDRDMAVYVALGNWLRNCYDHPVATGQSQGASIILTLPSQGANRVRLRENIAVGQLVRNFTVSAQHGGSWIPLASGSSVGATRILLFGADITGQLNVTFSPPAQVSAEAFSCVDPTD